MSSAALLAEGTQILEREAAYLDDQRWDDWLALYAEDCEYWLPMWRTDETLTVNPQVELSHIYYANRAGLEDRVVRLRSRRSPASAPMPRTTHLISSVLPTAPPDDGRISLRSSWASHIFFPRRRQSHAFFGRSDYELISRAGTWLIARKKIVVQNDYIPTMLDFYCV